MNNVALLPVSKPTGDVVSHRTPRRAKSVYHRLVEKYKYVVSGQEANYIATLRDTFIQLEQPYILLAKYTWGLVPSPHKAKQQSSVHVF